MLRRLAILTAPLLLAACLGQPACYVTLSPSGRPTAEACQRGSDLVVHRITPDDDAFHTPPYVIAALMAEGFISGHASRRDVEKAGYRVRKLIMK